MSRPFTDGEKRTALGAIIAERDRYRLALDRIYCHTGSGTTPWLHSPDPIWIRQIAEAALYPEG